MEYDPLLYGKDSTENIISVQVSDGQVELYFADGTTEVRPNKYWILAAEKPDNSWVRMRGELPYKWGKQFDNRESFVKTRSFTKRYDNFSIWDAKESCMVNKGITYFKGMKPSDLSVLSFDLETTGLDPDSPEAKILLISNTFRSSKGHKIRKLFCYDEYPDQASMLRAWAIWVADMNPMVLTGHNIFSFDLNYMITIAGEELKMGRDGSALDQSNFVSYKRIDQTRGIDYKMVNCHGREIVDTMFLAYNYDAAAKKYDSYRLKRIIEIEGLQKEDREFYDASQIRFNYKDPVEWAKIKRYCEHDADDALALFELMATPYFYMTQMIPKSFQSVVCSATGSQINSMMIRAYLQDRHSLPKANEASEYEGAISIGNPGVYNNVGKIDVASLYPSIMIQYEVCAPAKDPERHFLGLVKTLTDLRLQYKKLGKTDKVYDDMQASFKILINSAYGFLGTAGLLFNHPPGAAFITKTGREILIKAIVWATGHTVVKVPNPEKKGSFMWVEGEKIAEGRGFKLVNADTDSISYCKGDMSEISEAEFEQHLSEVNAMYPERIRWEDDGIFPRVCVLKAKNYILYDGEKIKVKGSAIKATTKTVALKEFINTVTEFLIHAEGVCLEAQIKSLYHGLVQEIMQIEDITRWSLRKTISEKVMTSERLNETKVKDAIEGTEYEQNDKVRMFYLPDETLELEENFSGVYNRKRLLKNLHDTAKLFSPVLPNWKELCPNYSLVKKMKELYTVFGIVETQEEELDESA